MDTQDDTHDAFVNIQESTRSMITSIMVKIAGEALVILTLIMAYGLIMVRHDATMIIETVLLALITTGLIIYAWKTPPSFSVITASMEKASQVDIIKVADHDAGSEIPLGSGTIDDTYIVKHVLYAKDGVEHGGVIISKQHYAGLYSDTEAAHPILPNQGTDPGMLDYSMLQQARNGSND